MTSLANAHLLKQVSLRPLPPVRPPPAIVGPTLRPLPRDLVARLAGRRAAERAGDGEAGVRHRCNRLRLLLGARGAAEDGQDAVGESEVHRPPLRGLALPLRANPLRIGTTSTMLRRERLESHSLPHVGGGVMRRLSHAAPPLAAGPRAGGRAPPATDPAACSSRHLPRPLVTVANPPLDSLARKV